MLLLSFEFSFLRSVLWTINYFYTVLHFDGCIVCPVYLQHFLNTHAQSDSSSFVISCTILFNNADQMNSSLFSVTLIIVRRSTDNTIVKRKGTKYEKFSNIHHTKMGIILGAPEG